MTKFLAHLLMLCIFTFADASEIPNKIVNTGIGTKTASVRLINKSPYITIPEIARVLGYKTLNTHEIAKGDKLLKFAPGSFFVVFESAKNMRMAQMLQPAIIIDHKIYIPYLSFFSSLEILELFEVEITEKEIQLTSNDAHKPEMKEQVPLHVIQEINEQPKAVTKKKAELNNKTITEEPQNTDNFFDAFVQTSKIMRKNLQYLNPDTTEKREVSKPYETKIPPNRYVLPKKLKRSELEEK